MNNSNFEFVQTAKYVYYKPFENKC